MCQLSKRAVAALEVLLHVRRSGQPWFLGENFNEDPHEYTKTAVQAGEDFEMILMITLMITKMIFFWKKKFLWAPVCGSQILIIVKNTKFLTLLTWKCQSGYTCVEYGLVVFISGILASLTSATIAQISKTKKLCVDVLAVLCDRVSCFNFVRCEVFFPGVWFWLSVMSFPLCEVAVMALLRCAYVLL